MRSGDSTSAVGKTSALRGAPNSSGAAKIRSGIVFGPAGTPIHNEDPLLVNTVDSRRKRPDAVTSIPNLFLASDYVKTYTDLATMERANEAERRAVNGILATTGVQAAPCALWPLQEPAILAPSKSTDALRYALGLPHILSYL